MSDLIFTIAMSPSMCSQALGLKQDVAPFVVRTSTTPGSALHACNHGFTYWEGERQGWTSRPTGNCTDWKRMRGYVIDGHPGYLTHQSNQFLSKHFRVPSLVAPIKAEIQEEDRRLFPSIPFDGDYQPPTNGLNQIWCSSSDTHYEYLNDTNLIDPDDWANVAQYDFPARIGLVFEAYFKLKSIKFTLNYPRKRG